MAETDKNYKEKADEFLAVASQFKLGDLPTEQQHPFSHNLSHLAEHDLLKAITLLKTIDDSAIGTLSQKKAAISQLAGRIHETIQRGNRVFLCGCVRLRR